MSEVFKNFKDNEKKVTKALTYKEWDITTAMTASHGVYVYDGEWFKQPHLFNIEDPLVGSVTSEAVSDIGAAPPQYRKLVFDSVNHLYYEGKDNPVDVFCNNDPSLNFRDLNGMVTVISVPSALYGERIKPGSFVYSSSNYNFIDDGYGNLLHEDDASGSLCATYETSSIMYLPFSEGYRYFDRHANMYMGLSDLIETCSLRIENNGGWEATAYNVQFGNGTIASASYGSPVHFHGSMSFQETHSLEVPHDNSFIEIENTKGWDVPDHWSLSLYVRAPESQSVTASWYGPRDSATTDKRRTLKNHGSNCIITSREWWGHNCPFELEIINQNHSDNGKLQFNVQSKTDGNMTQLKSTTLVNDGKWHHVYISLRDTLLGMSINGALEDFEIYTNTGKNTRLQKNIHIGARPLSYKTKYWNDDESKWRYQKKNKNYIKPFSGSIDQVRFYDWTNPDSNAAISVDPSFHLAVSESWNQSNKVGNVFYDHGIAVISTPYVMAKNYLPGIAGVDSGYSYSTNHTNSRIKFQGQHRIKEHLYICNILDGEYNATYNPTARTNYDLKNEELQPYTTHSEFNPYITTIGLYNDRYELVAVGKLAQPVKNQDDYDNTFQVRFDTTV